MGESADAVPMESPESCVNVVGVPLLRTCIAEVPLQEGICRVIPGKPLAVKKGIGMVIFQSPNEKQGGTRDVSADGVLLPWLLSVVR